MVEIKIDEEIIKRGGHHRFFGVELNHVVWDLLGKDNRTPEEDELMLHAAHGSYFHWAVSGKAEAANYQRGEWMLSRVYAFLNVPERAMYYAKRCKQITEDKASEMDDFDLAYADEAMARAHAVEGNKEGAEKYLAEALAKGEKIKDAEAKSYFFSDIHAGPWYGVDVKT